MSDADPALMVAGAPDFSDGKAPDALRTIGEVSRALGIRQHVLRYWEEQFPALQPLKRSGGRRYFRPEDIALIRTIDRLVHREGYTLKGARQVLAGGMPPQPQPTRSQPAEFASDLLAIRDRLARALAEA